MIILDTDHLSVLRFQTAERCKRLVSRLQAAGNGEVCTTIVNAVEQVKGWLATVNKERDALRQVNPYRELARLFDFYAHYQIAEFDEASAYRFKDLRQSKIRVGTSDLKIASIALTTNSLLLTANYQDFKLIPGSRFSNWMD